MTAPVLVIDGDPADWLPTSWEDPIGGGLVRYGVDPPAREWLAVDTLPIVTMLDPEWRTRPLRAGDTVTLVEQDDIGAGQVRVLPFGTATVAEVLSIVERSRAYVDPRTDGCVRKMCRTKTAWRIVDHAEQSDTWTLPLDALPNARPGDWAIRLTGTEALG